MFYDHPDLYDVLFRPEGHVAHYSALAERHPGPVLELGCGTGQITVPLARPGRRVVGLDKARSMLFAGQRRAESVRAQVEFLEADMRNFELDGQFGFVFVARNSLLHLHTASDLAAAFAAVRRHLAPGGVFAFDIFNPNVRLLARSPGERAPVMRAQSKEYGDVVVEATADYDAASQVNRATWYVSTETQPDRWVLPLHLRCIFPEELPLLLSASGFRLRSRVGDLRGGAFESASPRQVCVCDVAGPT